MSRLRFLFASVAAIALAITFAACGGGGGGSSNENPQKVVENATLKGVHSGKIDLLLRVNAKGAEGGNLDVSLTGPFESEGKGKLPQLDLSAKLKGSINGEAKDFEGGLVLLPNSAYVNYQGTDYEVDPTTFGFVESIIKRAQKQGGTEGQTGGMSACQEAAEKLKLTDFLENLKNEGSADVSGVSTTKVSGDLNVAGALDAVISLTENPACSAQLSGAGPLPSTSELEAAKGQIKSAVKKAHGELYIGEDHIVRRGVAQLSIEPPESSGGGPKSVDLEFDLTLSGVNESQEIVAPSHAKPLNDLFLKLGVNPIELLGTAGKGGGLGSLLEGLQGAGGGPSGGGAGSPGAEGGKPSAAGQQAYLKCLQGAKTPADLQKCAELLK